jgi:hypothetical protein
MLSTIRQLEPKLIPSTVLELAVHPLTVLLPVVVIPC